MTIRKVNEIIDYLIDFLKENRFIQNLSNYLVTIQNNQSNLVLTKEICDRIIADFDQIEQTDLSANLEKVLYASTSKPFTTKKYYDRLIQLREANYTDYSTQYGTLSNIITEIQADTNQNLLEIEKIKKVFKPFQEKDYSELQGSENAIFSIILNNVQSYKNLKLLNQELKRWDTGLFVYQQILSSDTPKSLDIVEVSEGSIEILINLDFSAVSSLVELFTKGLEAFSAYLAYKAIKYELVKAFHDNEKLLKGEENQEKLMLENVKESIINKLKQQAEASRQSDIEALDKKIDIVTKLLTDQIVKGNNVRLISAPEGETDIEVMESEKQEIFIKSQKIFKTLDEPNRQKLINVYVDREAE
jgi:small nuclear ribonucleoprotein (snRNP)-like protein